MVIQCVLSTTIGPTDLNAEVTYPAVFVTEAPGICRPAVKLLSKVLRSFPQTI